VLIAHRTAKYRPARRPNSVHPAHMPTGIVSRPNVSDSAWVADSLAEDEVSGVVHTTDGAVRRGRYQWFWTRDGCCYFAKGYNGQYVFVHKDRDVVVVRFGEGYGKVDWTALFTRIAESV